MNYPRTGGNSITWTPPREEAEFFKFNQRIDDCGLEGREKNVLKNFDFIESDNFKGKKDTVLICY